MPTGSGMIKTERKGILPTAQRQRRNMKENEIKEMVQSFELAIHKAEETEFMFARDLQILLDYSEWRNFSQVIDKAKIACKNSGNSVDDHFVFH